MSSHPDDFRPAPRSPRWTPRATKLLQAAALAAVLVPLGSVAVETATIRCVTTESGGCSGAGIGSYDGGGGVQSNTWEFYRNNSYNDLIYKFQLSGTPTSNFSLEVTDVVTTQAGLAGSMGAFSDLRCIPTYAVGRCGLFDVTPYGTPTWAGNYRATISWFANDDPLSKPPLGTFVTILQAHGDSGVFDFMLGNITYDPLVVPIPGDPALGGEGDSFSRFGGFAGNPVPEPASLILVGTGLAGAIYRARRRKRQP